MKLHRRVRKRPEDTAALSDLAFLLIVYFIVIAGFNVNEGFLMNLPAKNSTRLILKDDLMRFEFDDAGALLYRDTEVDLNFAESAIRSNIAYHPNLAVILTIAPATPWQQVVSFVELAQRLEVDSFSFTMKKDGS
jgi:biopolymer transport protein ExbD